MNNPTSNTNESKSQSHEATITFKVSSNPLSTLAAMEAQICDFLKEMQTFHESKAQADPEDELNETASTVYNMAVTIHAVIGLTMGGEGPEMLTDLYQFCRDMGLQNLEDLVNWLSRKEGN
jgi:hypothetical protein